MDILATLFLGLATLLLCLMGWLLSRITNNLQVIHEVLSRIAPEIKEITTQLQQVQSNAAALSLSERQIESLQLPWTDVNAVRGDDIPQPPIEGGTNLTELAFHVACAVNYVAEVLRGPSPTVQQTVS